MILTETHGIAPHLVDRGIWHFARRVSVHARAPGT
eukprot:COSAG06_NODE_1362_length_9703_cov_30.651708_6_plen_35_part_00